MALNTFGILASYSQSQPADASFWIPRYCPDNVPTNTFGRSLDYADYSEGFAGHRPISFAFRLLEAPDAAQLYQIWDDARINKYSRVWLSYFDTQSGTWKISSAVMLQPRENGFEGRFYQNFTLNFSKLGIHSTVYAGGQDPWLYGGSTFVYGDSPFTVGVPTLE